MTAPPPWGDAPGARTRAWRLPDPRRTGRRGHPHGPAGRVPLFLAVYCSLLLSEGETHMITHPGTPAQGAAR
ncbi:hypothetical protein GCM10027072_18920 [Streptomyces bullii]